MTVVPACEVREYQQRRALPADELNRQVRAVLNHAVIAHRDKIKVYESLRNLNEVVGTEYGDWVLYELMQNAHDAHRAEDRALPWSSRDHVTALFAPPLFVLPNPIRSATCVDSLRSVPLL